MPDMTAQTHPDVETNPRMVSLEAVVAAARTRPGSQLLK